MNIVVHTALFILLSDIIEEEKIPAAFTEMHAHTWVMVKQTNKKRSLTFGVSE